MRFSDSSTAGHSERAMLYHELEDGMYSITSYFFAKVRANYALRLCRVKRMPKSHLFQRQNQSKKNECSFMYFLPVKVTIKEHQLRMKYLISHQVRSYLDKLKIDGSKTSMINDFLFFPPDAWPSLISVNLQFKDTQWNIAHSQKDQTCIFTYDQEGAT